MHRHNLAILSCTAVLLMTGCGGRSSSSSSEAETTAVTSSTAVSDETTKVTTKTETTAAKTTAEPTTEATTGEEQTESATGSSSERVTIPDLHSGSDVDEECLAAAQAFYKVYLDHDAEAVYSMFDKAEIDGYNELIAPELGGASAKEVFRRAAVIRAIEDSMDNISEIMEYYADSDKDVWSFSVRGTDLEEVSAEELAEFNETLGTDYTKAYTCQYMFYNDDTNNKSFTGNSASFVQSGGVWYLSYSSAMGTDLLNFIDINDISAE